MKPITIELTEYDFDRLHNTAAEWASHKQVFQKQSNRFDPEPSLDWQMAYWVDSYTEALLCQAFLSSKDHESQTVWDEGMMEYAVLTNYRTESW